MSMQSLEWYGNQIHVPSTTLQTDSQIIKTSCLNLQARDLDWNLPAVTLRNLKELTLLCRTQKQVVVWTSTWTQLTSVWGVDYVRSIGSNETRVGKTKVV